MAETIYMIHGMCCGPWVWENYCAYLSARGYTCVAPPLCHHDEAPCDETLDCLAATGLLDYARALVEDIERRAIEPIVIGHSLGGLLAQIVCSRLPVRALVLLGSVPPAGLLALHPRQIQAYSSILLRWGWWRKPIRPTFRDAAHGMLYALPPSLQRSLYARLGYESGRAVRQAGFWFLSRHPAAYVDASTVTCPVLVTAGERDRLIAGRMTRKLAERYAPHATLHVFPDRAHWLLDGPGWQESAAYVGDWLDSALVAA